jgi:hypothetical protein
VYHYAKRTHSQSSLLWQQDCDARSDQTNPSALSVLKQDFENEDACTRILATQISANKAATKPLHLFNFFKPRLSTKYFLTTGLPNSVLEGTLTGYTSTVLPKKPFVLLKPAVRL